MLTYTQMSEYVHKQLPLDDEELSCRHGAETLVGSDEEEGAHPVRRGTAAQNLIFLFILGFYCNVFISFYINCRYWFQVMKENKSE